MIIIYNGIDDNCNENDDVGEDEIDDDNDMIILIVVTIEKHHSGER